ncbi:MAG TPA: DUF1232 domain-containing protein [Acidobacteriota bacterium]|nr:DUF1232 domain-containing protein [Acidobacteriota bacterium]
MVDDPTSVHREAYSPEGLRAKLVGFARLAGREVVEKALLLSQVLRDPRTPAWAKTTVIGALGYFIAPLDAIPDLIPGAGYTDDLSVLVMALAAVAASITPGMRARARRGSARWFGESPEPGPVVECGAPVAARPPR